MPNAILRNITPAGLSRAFKRIAQFSIWVILKIRSKDGATLHIIDLNS